MAPRQSLAGIWKWAASFTGVTSGLKGSPSAITEVGATASIAFHTRVTADDVYRESMAAARVRATFLPAMELLPNIGLIAVLGYGGHQVLDGALTLGEFVAFNVYVVLLIWPLRMLGMIIA